MKVNLVFVGLAAAAGAVAVTLAVLAAEHHGKRRAMWLMEAGGNSCCA